MDTYSEFIANLQGYMKNTPDLSIETITQTFNYGGDDCRKINIEFDATNTVIEIWTTWYGSDDKYSDDIDELAVTNKHDEHYNKEDAEHGLDGFEKWMVEEAGIVSIDAQQSMNDVEYTDYDQMNADYRAAVGF